MDEDLETMSREELIAEAKLLRAGIRQHRDATNTGCVGGFRSSGTSYQKNRDRHQRFHPRTSSCNVAGHIGSLWATKDKESLLGYQA